MGLHGCCSCNGRKGSGTAASCSDASFVWPHCTVLLTHTPGSPFAASPAWLQNCGAVGHPGSYYDAPAADPLRPTNPPAAPRVGFPLLAGEALAEPYKQQLQQQQSQPQYEGMYWESYEQASLALRQLHFERMQRHGLAAAPPG